MKRSNILYRIALLAVPSQDREEGDERWITPPNHDYFKEHNTKCEFALLVSVGLFMISLLVYVLGALGLFGFVIVTNLLGFADQVPIVVLVLHSNASPFIHFTFCIGGTLWVAVGIAGFIELMCNSGKILKWVGDKCPSTMTFDD